MNARASENNTLKIISQLLKLGDAMRSFCMYTKGAYIAQLKIRLKFPSFLIKLYTDTTYA